MQENVKIPETVRFFLLSLLQEANISYLDEKMRDDMVQELFYQFDNFLAAVVAQNLKQQDLEQFIIMNKERKSQEEIQNFIKDKIPNAQEIFVNAFTDFKSMYLENVKEKKHKVTSY